MMLPSCHSFQGFNKLDVLIFLVHSVIYYLGGKIQAKWQTLNARKKKKKLILFKVDVLLRIKFNCSMMLIKFDCSMICYPR